MREKKFCKDSPDDGNVYLMKVTDGDLLLLGTDGVFDNLFEHEIIKIIKSYKKNFRTKQNALAIAKAICQAA